MAERWRSILAKIGWVEWVFLVFVATYFLLRWLAPGNPLRFAAQIGAMFFGVTAALRLVHAGVRQAIWRLRNRLIVVYMFIAVVPVALIIVLVGISAYSLTGQIAVYLVATELDRMSTALLGPAQGLIVTPPNERVNRIQWMVPYLEQRYPGLALLVRDHGEWRYPQSSAITLPPEGWKQERGIVLNDGRLYLWCHTVVGQGEALMMTPLTRELLAGLVPDLGQVTLVNPSLLEPGQPEPRRPSGRGVDARQGRVPPAVNRADIEVTWWSWLPVAVWEKPGERVNGPLVVTSRPSAVLRTLFSQHVDWAQGYGFIIFVVVASMFLLVELVSLIIGISLSRTITGAVHNLYQGTQRVMEGDFAHHIEVRGNDQLGDLGRSFNRMTENLERLVRVEKEKERLQSELEIAREVQNQLYPKSIPALERLELIALCNPARTVSGDYYDYLNLQEARVALAIGDVAGKGISAALLMATLQSSLRTQICACLETAAAATAQGERSCYDTLPTSRLVSQLNQQLFAFTSPEKFATFYFGVYDDVSSLLTYTNAGHPPPILIRKGEPLRLETNGMVVGAFPFAEYGESCIELKTGDLLVCFTDGITEPQNEYGEMFGEDGLIEVLLKNASRDTPEIIDSVMESVHHWTNSPELQDDMTLLLARRR